MATVATTSDLRHNIEAAHDGLEDALVARLAKWLQDSGFGTEAQAGYAEVLACKLAGLGTETLFALLQNDTDLRAATAAR